MIDEGDCGAIGGMKICRVNRSIRRKTALTPLCPQQISHDESRVRAWAVIVGKPETNNPELWRGLYLRVTKMVVEERTMITLFFLLKINVDILEQFRQWRRKCEGRIGLQERIN
jgi:hypothetical protein